MPFLIYGVVLTRPRMFLMMCVVIVCPMYCLRGVALSLRPRQMFVLSDVDSLFVAPSQNGHSVSLRKFKTPWFSGLETTSLTTSTYTCRAFFFLEKNCAYLFLLAWISVCIFFCVS